MPDSENNPSRSLFSGLRDLFRRTRPQSAPETTAESYNERPIDLMGADRSEWLRFAQDAPLLYGCWGDLKRLYKAAERSQDFEFLAILMARMDTAVFTTALDRRHPETSTDNDLSLESITRFCIRGTHGFVLTGWSEGYLHYFKTLDLSDPVQPRLQTPPAPYLSDIAIVGDQVFAGQIRKFGETPAGIHQLDISEPKTFRISATSKIRSPGALVAMEPYLIAINDQHRGTTLLALNVSNPAQPVILSETKLPYLTSVQVQDKTVVALSKTPLPSPLQKLHVFDFSNPSQPRLKTSYEIPWNSVFTPSGNFAVILTALTDAPAGPGLYIYNLLTGQRVGQLALRNGLSLVVRGNFAFIGVEPENYGTYPDGGLRIVDISDPAVPKLRSVWKGGSINALAANGDLLLASILPHRYGTHFLGILDVSDPMRPLLLGTPPSRETLAYMKRRARRTLQALALRDPERYIALAVDLLLRTGKERDEIDTGHQWITMDLLFAASPRYAQSAHGRGGYVLKNRLSLRRREERHPELWDRHPERVRQLFTSVELPWQIHEAALKMLRDQGQPLPELTEAALTRFFRCPSPLLVVAAAHQVAAHLAQNRPVAADLAAEAFFKGGKNGRETIRTAVARSGQEKPDNRWVRAFAQRLCALASEEATGEPLSRRQTVSFDYLIATFPILLSRQLTPALAMRLYATRQPEIRAWVLEALRVVPAAKLLDWLQTLEPLADELRREALEQLQRAMQTESFDLRQLKALLLHSSDWIRTVAWDLVNVSLTAEKNLLDLWNLLLSPLEASDSLRTAVDSPTAVAIFQRLPFDGVRWPDLLEKRPFLVDLLPPGVLKTVVRTLAPETLVTLTASASESRWELIREAIAGALQVSRTRNRFWQIAWGRINDTGDPLLSARLLDETGLADTFLDIEEADDYLNTANPLFGPLLGRWTVVHRARFTRDSPLLLIAATHSLPEIRAFGLDQVRIVGMRLPFALRLLESEIPASVEVGESFIEAVSGQIDREVEYALALCDSPKASVRAYGRRYLTVRWERLPAERLLVALAEHSDPQMRTFVAARLLEPENAVSEPAVLARFDREVLRDRNRSRKAKELVKLRYAHVTSHDVATLLELARSRTARDAEWALGQLARLALQGVEIEGFSVEGHIEGYGEGYKEGVPG